jgi:hypothetical protein
MRHSTARILVSHAGNLPRPEAIDSKRRFGNRQPLTSFFWESSPAGDSPGLLALDLAGGGPSEAPTLDVLWGDPVTAPVLPGDTRVNDRVLSSTAHREHRMSCLPLLSEGRTSCAPGAT